MSSRDSFTRRQFATLLAALLASAWSPARAAETDVRDQGIGGTGVVAPPENEDGDRGIGGTGVIGTIRKFGSIYVNGLRIAYPKNVIVRIDGDTAHVADLKLGQVVRVVAQRRNGVYSTGAIDVTSEVVGPIEAISSHSMTVLGQTVLLDGVPGAAHWKAGDFVAVSGLRRPDGGIAASLISSRPNGPARVAGPVHEGPGGVLKIGALNLKGADRALVGRRAFVEGRMVDQSLEVDRANSEDSLFVRRDLRQLLIEAYVERTPGGLRLGSGLKVAGSSRGLPLDRSVRAVIRTSVDAHGGLTANSIRAVRMGGNSGPHSGAGHSHSGTTEHSGASRTMRGGDGAERGHDGASGRSGRVRPYRAGRIPGDGDRGGSFLPKEPGGFGGPGGLEGPGGPNGIQGGGFGGPNGFGGGGLGGGRR